MSLNRTRRVVPTFALAGALLAVMLTGAAGAASPPVGDWRMNEGSGTIARRLLGLREQRDDSGEPDLGHRPARPGDQVRRDRRLRDRARQRLARHLRCDHDGRLGEAGEDRPPRT